VVGGSRISQQLLTIYDTATTTDQGNALAVADYAILSCYITTTNTPALTLKFAGSIDELAPDLDLDQNSPSSTASSTAIWDYVEVVDLEDGNTIDGDTGLSWTGTSDTRLIEVNTNLLKWLTADITSYTTGSTTVKCRPANNQ